MSEEKCSYCGMVCELDNHTLGDCNIYLKARAEAAEKRIAELEAAVSSFVNNYRCGRQTETHEAYLVLEKMVDEKGGEG